MDRLAVAISVLALVVALRPTSGVSTAFAQDVRAATRARLHTPYNREGAERLEQWITEQLGSGNTSYLATDVGAGHRRLLCAW